MNAIGSEDDVASPKYKSRSMENANVQEGMCQNIRATNTRTSRYQQLNAITRHPDERIVDEIERLYHFSRSRFCRGAFLNIWHWLTRTLDRKK